MRRRARPGVVSAVLAILALTVAPACGSHDAEIPTAERPPEGRGRPAPSIPPPAPRGPTNSPHGRVDPTANEPLLDELAEPPTPEELAAAEAMPGPISPRTPPARGCALQVAGPVHALEHAGPPAIVALDDAFLVAAYNERGVGLVRMRPGSLPEPFGVIPLASVPSTTRRAAPSMTALPEGQISIAMVDGSGRVLEAQFDGTALASAPIAHEVAASGADPRFAPAVKAIEGRRVVAWTDGSSTPMRVKLAVLELDQVIATHDPTPEAGGAAAPLFVEGPGLPVLMFLDPRVAISVAHRVQLAADGSPGRTEVARPLNLTAQPPAIAVARASGSSHTWLAYSAVGNLATRAVGLVDASGTEAASPLVPGLGYGEPLTIDAVAGDRTVVFALEAPSAAAADAPHDVRLRVVDDRGAGEALTFPGASDPAIARSPDGMVAVAHRHGDSVMVGFVRCSD